MQSREEVKSFTGGRMEYREEIRVLLVADAWSVSEAVCRLGSSRGCGDLPG